MNVLPQDPANTYGVQIQPNGSHIATQVVAAGQKNADVSSQRVLISSDAMSQPAPVQRSFPRSSSSSSDDTVSLVPTVSILSNVHQVQGESQMQESWPTSSLPANSSAPLHIGLRTIAPPLQDKRKVMIKSSIPPVDGSRYIRECESAAVASRLPPNNMSSVETSVMRQHLSHLQISTYLTTRNAILRLWVKNPLLWVTVEEAQGVAREERHFLLCAQIWEFLVRHGYINFGCLEVPVLEPIQGRECRNIVVVGAGIAGLSTARQIQTLLVVFRKRLQYNYKVILLEARSRIGGRVYSHELKTAPIEQSAARVDLGAQIVTGFSGGNPLATLLQRQLSIPYHTLVHAKKNKIHGHNGRTIESGQDVRVEGLFNLLLDAAARFRLRNSKFDSEPFHPKEEIVESNTIDEGAKARQGGTGVVANKVLGVSKIPGQDAAKPIDTIPLDELQRLGFRLKPDAKLPLIIEAESLGQTLTNVLEAYSTVAEISATDKDILEWHWANMEYACGTNLDNLSLKHWDQDDGNEFRGHHAMMIGGYSQLARGLALAPSKLNIRSDAVVQRIATNGVALSTGEPIPADKIVITVPLGVLKANTIEFSPSLPAWKLQAISNLGFGLLNKVVLVYEEQFWESDIDLLGNLSSSSSTNDDLSSTRGRFYMFWNCTSHANGHPVLIALMAGDAAAACETTSSEALVQEATAILRRIYGQVPLPSESIVTRWGQDPFACGSYSYIGPRGTGADYDTLAKPINEQWFFAGEATCRTHCSTVHGAYLSGLAAAREVIESIIGEQKISQETPLVPVKMRPGSASSVVKADSRKRKFETLTGVGDSIRSMKEKLEHLMKIRTAKENDALTEFIETSLGPRPEQPKRTNANPFLIFQKEKWQECRVLADKIQQTKQKDPEVKATKNQIRACLGQTWRETPEDEKKRWVDIVNQRRQGYDMLKAAWDSEQANWERRSAELTKEFDEERRPFFVTEEERQTSLAIQAKEQIGQ